MDLVNYLHNSSSSPATYRRKHARLFAGQQSDLFVLMLIDFKKLYYRIVPEAGMDRRLLLTKPCLDNVHFNARSIIPYIVESVGDTELLHDVLSDLNALDAKTWSNAFGIAPSLDLQGFYFKARASTKEHNAELKSYLDGFLGERIEMFCNEAGEKLQRLSVSSQHFLVTRKCWMPPFQVRKSFMAAAGNLANALPIGQPEASFINRMADRIAQAIVSDEHIADTYRQFLTEPPLKFATREREARLNFIKLHYKVLTTALGLKPVLGVNAKPMDNDAVCNQDGTIDFNDLPDQGIRRMERADIFNLSNHEVAHHIMHVASDEFMFANAAETTRKSVAFNNTIYTFPEVHLGAYHNQYAERFCDTFAVMVLERICHGLNIDMHKIMRRADYQIVEEGVCRRLLTEDEIRTAGLMTGYRTETNKEHLGKNNFRELVYAINR